MAIKTISKSIEINAAADTVWKVLFDDTTYRQWTSAFSPGSRAIGDWQAGSQMQFVDDSLAGLVAEVTEVNPPNLMSLTYLGAIDNGKIDAEGEEGAAFKDAKEIYRLNENDGVTRLEIASDMIDTYYNDMSEAWDVALKRIKQLSEEE